MSAPGCVWRSTRTAPAAAAISATTPANGATPERKTMSSNPPGSPAEWFEFFINKAKEMGVQLPFDTPASKPSEAYPQAAIDEIATLKAQKADLRRNLDNALELVNGKNQELTAVRGENES